MHRILLSAIEDYVRNCGEDLRDIKTTLNANGKRLLDLDFDSRKRHYNTEDWQGKTAEDLQSLDAAISVHARTTEVLCSEVSLGFSDAAANIKHLRTEADERALSEWGRIDGTSLRLEKRRLIASLDGRRE
jgi:hypothetical protein